jgi:hypothetical protein
MKSSLGEDKQFECRNCKGIFPKKRYDQICCSKRCASAYHATLRPAWSERTDREQCNAKRNARYYANREQELAKQKEWRKANPEAARSKAKAQYEKHKEKRNEQTRQYKKSHPEMRQKEYRNAQQKRPWRQCLLNAKNRSDKKNFAFDLTREWCEQVWTGNCAVTGLPFSFGSQTHFPFSPSIDRIDSSLGYLQTNCRFVLFAVNSLKGTGTDQQMLQIAQAIVQNCALEML